MSTDDIELWSPKAQARVPESHAIQHIEELASELQIETAFRTEAIVLREPEIEVVDSMTTDVRQCSARVSKSKRSRLAEHARVEPAAQTIMRVAGKPQIGRASCRERV